jgi:DNA-binding IclR family transcriptional regulator
MSVYVQLDQAKAAAFEGRLVEVLNAGALSLMVSVGHRTRLFDAMAELPPATSIEIARAAQLQERYVREWLGAMVAAGVVDYDAASQTYRLPQEHAAYLTRAAEPSNFAVFAQ